MGKPSAPEGPLAVSDIQKDSVTLSWKPPKDDGGSEVMAYVIEKRDKSRNGPWVPALTFPVKSTEAIVPKLMENINYDFRVKAKNAKGLSSPLETDRSVLVKNPFNKLVTRPDEEEPKKQKKAITRARVGAVEKQEKVMDGRIGVLEETDEVQKKEAKVIHKAVKGLKTNSVEKEDNGSQKKLKTSSADIDTEALINTVRAHPIIWNFADPSYTDKPKKAATWNIVASALVQNFEEKDSSEKNEIIEKITCRWKNVKDNYIRSYKKSTGLGKTMNYVYSKHLLFLNILLESASWQPESSSAETPLPTSSVRSTPAPAAIIFPQSATASDSARRSEATAQRMDVAPGWTSLVNALQDEDRAFFESLLPTIKTFTRDQKLEFRVDVLNLIRKKLLPPSPPHHQ